MQVVSTTSYDDNFVPQNILSPGPSTFYMTTGLYPQEITLELSEIRDIRQVIISHINVCGFEVYGCDNNPSLQFNKIGEIHTQNLPRICTETIQCKGHQCKYLKIVILNGYGRFTSIHNVKID